MNFLEKMLLGIGILPQDMENALKNMKEFSNQVRMIESDNRIMAVPRKKDGTLASTAKGVYQFTDTSVPTGIQRMRNMASKYDAFDDSFINTIPMNPQDWSDEQANAMFFANLFAAPGTDSDLKEVSKGSMLARHNLYKNVHHTDADEATIERMLKFIPSLNQPVDALFGENTNLNSAFTK
tara:strand:+ start:1035 stop:1577 length:543 start_codon:yes stop_codon:yes gene_type:complete